MRVYEVKVFARFQRRERIGDKTLAKAVRSAEQGLFDADLGGGLIKQRVARPGQGKSGGYRTVIAYRRGDRAVFLFGFAKSAKADLTPNELSDLAKIGARWFRADVDTIDEALADDRLMEVDYGEEDES